MLSPHISQAYDAELGELRKNVISMGVKAAEMLDLTVEALLANDNENARAVIVGDRHVNEYRSRIDELVVRIIATRQPAATDLRAIIAAMKIANDLERVGDYAVNIAYQTVDMQKAPEGFAAESLTHLQRECRSMTDNVIRAYEDLDKERAIVVWQQDDIIDDLFSDQLRTLRHDMNETPGDNGDRSRVQTVLRCIERIGDHIVNVANHVHYIVEGSYYDG